MTAVNGIAFTVPAEPAPAAGIVLAADDARFRQPETGRGLIPSGAATSRAPAQPGRGNAKRILLTAEEHGAAEASRTRPRPGPGTRLYRIAAAGHHAQPGRR